jgi:methyl-accepting chemotaxis protein
MSMAEQRKQLYVKRNFQQSLILEVLLTTFIVLNVIVIIGYFLIDSMSDVQDLKVNLAYVVAVIEVVSFVWIYRHNLKMSHRIAGPVWSMESGLKKIGEGDLNITIRLRKNDNFQEVGETMNQTIHNIREKIVDVKLLVNELENSEGKNTDLLQKLNDALSYFKTEPQLIDPGVDEAIASRTWLK